MKRADRKPKEPKLLRPAANAYEAGRYEYQERYGTHIAQARNWRYAAFASMAIAAISVTGLVYVKADQRVLTYIAEVNGDGHQVGGRFVGAGAKPTQEHIRAALFDWIVGARVVYVDGKAISAVNNKTYAMTLPGSPAFQQLAAYHSANSPYDRAAQETVDVRVESVMPISDDTWRIEWVETTRARGGREQSEKRWQATATIEVRTPTNPKLLVLNVFGIFVKNFAWQERL